MNKFILIVLLFCPNVYCRTTTQLISDTRILINDATSGRQRFTDTQIQDFLGEAQRIVDIRTGCNQKTYTFNLAAGSTYYSLPNNFITPLRVTRDYLEIIELTPASLDSRSSEWESQAGLPTYYYINFSSRTQIGFAPFSGVSTETGTVRVDYTAYSADLTSGSSIPFDGYKDLYAYHHALVYYAASRLLIVDDKNELGAFFTQTFEQLLDTMSKKCMDRPNYRPSLTGRRQ